MRNILNWIRDLIKRIGEDKILHFLVSLYITAIAAVFIASLGWPIWAVILTSVCIGLVIGVAKELYDKKHGGFFDWQDIVADVIGIAAAEGIVLLFL